MIATYKTVSIENAGQDLYRVRYTGQQSGIEGMAGNWTTSGVLADVHSVGGYLVICNPFNQKPIHVCESVKALNDWVETVTGLRP